MVFRGGGVDTPGDFSGKGPEAERAAAPAGVPAEEESHVGDWEPPAGIRGASGSRHPQLPAQPLGVGRSVPMGEGAPLPVGQAQGTRSSASAAAAATGTAGDGPPAPMPGDSGGLRHADEVHST